MTMTNYKTKFEFGITDIREKHFMKILRYSPAYRLGRLIGRIKNDKS